MGRGGSQHTRDPKGSDDGSLHAAAARFLEQLEAHFYGDQPPDLPTLANSPGPRAEKAADGRPIPRSPGAMPAMWPAHPTARAGRACAAAVPEEAQVKTLASAQALRVGQKVLEGGMRGLAIANQQNRARAAEKQLLVIIAANADRAAGKPERGMAGRISRRLHGAISERQVKRYLDKHSMVSKSSKHNGHNFTEVAHAKTQSLSSASNDSRYSYPVH